MYSDENNRVVLITKPQYNVWLEASCIYKKFKTWLHSSMVIYFSKYDDNENNYQINFDLVDDDIGDINDFVDRCRFHATEMHIKYESDNVEMDIEIDENVRRFSESLTKLQSHMLLTAFLNADNTQLINLLQDRFGNLSDLSSTRLKFGQQFLGGFMQVSQQSFIILLAIIK